MDLFVGRVVLPLSSLPREVDSRIINKKNYILQPRSARSKVRGHLCIYHAYIQENSGNEEPQSSSGPAPERQNSAPGPPDEPGWEMVDSNDGAAATTGDNTNDNDGDGGNSSTASLALPAGWEERQDANGRTYYVNHIARTTQWQHPSIGEVTNFLEETHFNL